MDAISPEVSNGFMDSIGPGGKYYRYSQIAVVVLALTFLTLLVLVLLPYFNGGKYQNSVSRIFGELPIKYDKPKTQATPVPRIIYPLPSGKQGWNFSHGEALGPNIQTAYVDPLDPAKGSQQIITAAIQSDTAVTKVTATLFTDNQNLTQEMKLISGVSTNGTWETSWKVTDTYNNIYHIDFSAESASGKRSETLTFRYP